MWIIKDWAGNLPFGDSSKYKFKTFDDAEEFLSRFLGDSYDTDRGEYWILQEREG